MNTFNEREILGYVIFCKLDNFKLSTIEYRIFIDYVSHYIKDNLQQLAIDFSANDFIENIKAGCSTEIAYKINLLSNSNLTFIIKIFSIIKSTKGNMDDVVNALEKEFRSLNKRKVNE